MKTRLFKKEDNKRKKEKCENLNNDEKKNSQKNTRKKERKLCMITFGIIRKEQVRKSDKKRKMDKSLQNLDDRTSIFDNIQKSNRIYP